MGFDGRTEEGNGDSEHTSTREGWTKMRRFLALRWNGAGVGNGGFGVRDTSCWV